jgi:hypothetical protein
VFATALLACSLPACGGSQGRDTSKAPASLGSRSTRVHVIASVGGVIHVAGASLTVPAGSLSQDSDVQLRVGGQPPVDLGGARLNHGATLRLPLAGSASKGSGAGYLDLRARSWVPRKAAADPANHVLALSVQHLSWYEPWTWDLGVVKSKLEQFFGKLVGYGVSLRTDPPRCAPAPTGVTAKVTGGRAGDPSLDGGEADYLLAASGPTVTATAAWSWKTYTLDAAVGMLLTLAGQHSPPSNAVLAAKVDASAVKVSPAELASVGQCLGDKLFSDPPTRVTDAIRDNIGCLGELNDVWLAPLALAQGLIIDIAGALDAGQDLAVGSTGTVTITHDGDAMTTLGIVWAGSQRGYGEIRPSFIFNGGDPTGVFSNAQWQAWGQPQATATGTGLYVAPGQIVAEGVREPARLVAFDLGDCHGKTVYRAIEWFFPQHGQSFDPKTYINICTGEYYPRPSLPGGALHHITGDGVAQRRTPSPSAEALPVRLNRGDVVRVICQLHGAPVDPNAPADESDVWERLQDGAYVSYLFVDTSKGTGFGVSNGVDLGFDPEIPVC